MKDARPKMKIAFLAGADRAATRLSIESVLALPGVEAAALLLDTERPGPARRLKNLRRNVRREGASYVLFRALEFAEAGLSRPARGLVPPEEVSRLLAAAFPGECFSLADIGKKYSVPVIEAGNLNSEKAANLLRDSGADLGIVLGGRILRRSTFGIPPMGCINLHKGAVPDYRGRPPGFWELFRGEAEAGVTVHAIDDGVDSGGVIARGRVAIHEKETLASLQKKLDIEGARVLAKAVAELAAGRAVKCPQPPSPAPPRTNPTRREIIELNRRRPGAAPLGGAGYRALKALAYILFHNARLHLLFRRLRKKNGSYPACVLLYHRVNDLSEDPLTTSRRAFAGHLLLLKKRFRVLSTPDLADCILQKKPIPAGSVCIHFDDCYRDVYLNAAPLLRAAGLPAAAFIASGFVGTDLRFAHDEEKYPFVFENLRAEELKELPSLGFTIGAHTVRHVNLGRIDTGLAREEILTSRSDLEKILAQPVKFFSYPFGKRSDVNRQARDLVKQAGFRALFSAYGGLATNTCDPFDIPRKGVHSEFSPLALFMEAEGISLGSFARSARELSERFIRRLRPGL